ncbi:MAG: D-2-hydroxyacid dehydrogenase [Spirochaetales bacterium]|jgi:phosphoglycerate dehydrogenase-like enzyme|nr:D-2-hydroxyacid dehydrogenase [Spirochaetales bacterium]
MKKILVDIPASADALRRLENSGSFEIKIVDEPSEESRPLPASLLRGVNFLLCTKLPTNINDLDALELVQIASAGYNQLLGLDLPGRKVAACNALGVFDTPIAEWNISMMVALARDLRGMIRNQEQGVWDRSARFQREIRGSVVGIWGYGGIGRETARICKQMAMTVYVMSRSGVKPRSNIFCVPGTGDPEGLLPDKVFTHGQESDFLSGLDFLIIAVPLTASTEGLIGEAELRLLPDTAYLLNPARGLIVSEQALLAALRDGQIAGAALDTHYAYPLPADHPLWSFPNVIMTPHISGSALSPNYVNRIWTIFEENARRFVAGDRLLNELTLEQLSGK